MDSIDILGIRIDLVTRSQALTLVDAAVAESRIDKSKRLAIATVNPEFIIQAQHDSDFKRALGKAGLALADGIGILWAGIVINYRPVLPKGIWRLPEMVIVGFCEGISAMVSKQARTKVVPEQISGSDFSGDIAGLLAKGGGSMFLLGEREGVAEKAGQALQKRYPGLQISGCFAGNGSPEGDDEVLVKVNGRQNDVVLVAYGAPKQDLWIERNLSKVEECGVAMGVGGTFLFLAGEVKRAPNIFRRLGLEWLYRLITQPWRWRRQLALPRFMWAVLWEKCKQ